MKAWSSQVPCAASGQFQGTAARWIDAHWIVHEIPKNIKIDLP